ncbi:MAG TPA: hypothetical protein PLB88_10825 [Thermoanaerobaculaceae bacterium]|nr:hypothetical protein [Thermoanaerobaculaceae bacterium]
MTRPTCGNCPYFQQKLGAPNMGECHYERPAMLHAPAGPGGIQTLSVWRPVENTALACPDHPKMADYVATFEPEPALNGRGRPSLDLRV